MFLACDDGCLVTCESVFSLISQRPGNEIPSNPWLRYALIEPATHIVIEADAVHIVVEGFVERLAQPVVVDAGGVDEMHIVLGELAGR